MNRSKQRQQSSLRSLLPVQILLLLCMSGVGRIGSGQCYVDPYTGRQVCTSPNAGWQPHASSPRSRTVVPNSPASSAPSSAHCRIRVGDGSIGSGTLIAVDELVGLVLTCSHLFDESVNRIVVTFPDGTRFAARLVDRDPKNDLAALAIRRPAAEPVGVSAEEPTGILTACGFGPRGEFRSIHARIVGAATAAGAEFPSLTIAGAVRPGDSGGGVLNAAGQLVGVIWGQREGLSYTTCGRPVRDFLYRLRGKPFVAENARPNRNAPGPEPPAPNAAPSVEARIAAIESQLRQLAETKQEKGDYLRPDALNNYLHVDAAANLGRGKFANRAEVDGKMQSLAARFESIHAQVESVQRQLEQIAASPVGFLRGLSLGKLIVGALGVGGPVAAAIVVASGLLGRRKRSRAQAAAGGETSLPTTSNAGESELERKQERAAKPVAVDSPPPPQRTVPETHYVPVEKDSFAKAHQWASEHVARKYPGATEVLQAQDSLIKQYMAAL